ncbi:hypothetical protein GCM10012285_66080 [Streptomyces kronopolitis]|uniref:Uncharacterized protein n=1 Tax=Streptomyces kronopolitis TaxID=1612435 RepID=A0ABQ2K3K0_9ACTN|nr:hypothetical protein [Streptomyces kronopolitis]GGN64210.1 hypothetical protein GCM10012285_66080 [Streptomyces kronopolitis]
MSPTDRAPRTHFASWRDVPAGIYATATQLKTMDLPRQPGPPAATVDGQDGIGRSATLTLYRIDESTPTSSTAAQLAAARARSETSSQTRTCADCGARPDRAPAVSDKHGALCPACWHIHTLRIRQDEARRERVAAVRTARHLLQQPLGVLHVDYTDRGHTPAGVRRAPAAARITVLGGANGLVITDPLLRLVSARAKGVPEGAEDPRSGAELLQAALSGLTVMIWRWTDLYALRAGLQEQQALWPLPEGHHPVVELEPLTAAWRGEITPDGRRPGPVPPGRADRMFDEPLAGPVPAAVTLHRQRGE